MAQVFSHGYALLVGVGDSAYSQWSLPAAVKDVEALSRVLTDPDVCAYPGDADHVRVLVNSGATRQAILEGLEWLVARVTADGEATAVVYFSGHGWVNQATAEGYLIPHDVVPFDVPASALPGVDFTAALRKLAARRLLVFIDSCHSGGMASAKGDLQDSLPPGFRRMSLTKGIVDEIGRGEGRAVFASCREDQRSWVRQDERMSIYTFHLIEALEGAGSVAGDTVVRVSNLINYLGKAVPVSARAMYSAAQTPFFDASTEDFPYPFKGCNHRLAIKYPRTSFCGRIQP